MNRQERSLGSYVKENWDNQQFKTNFYLKKIQAVDQRITCLKCPSSHQISKIRRLNLSMNNIESLKGIEKFRELESLSINNNQIKSLSEFDRI